MLTLHVVGDSISQHYGPCLQQYLAPRLAYSRKEGMPDAPAEPNGANGGDSALVLRYLRACRQRSLYWDVLLLNCGLHDVRTDIVSHAKQVPEDAYRGNLHAIVSLARDLAGHVVWVRTTSVIDAIHNAREQKFLRFAADIIRYNDIADAVMQENSIPCIDLHSFTQTLGDDVFADHVHFCEPARRAQAAFIAGWLTRLLVL